MQGRAMGWLAWPALAVLGLGLGCGGGGGPEEGGAGGAGGDGGGVGGGLVPGEPDPGRVTLHRLNRAEYDNTVRDLFGTTLTPADDFPADDHGFGFDHIADVLSVSPILFELYERAADLLVDEALVVPTAEAKLQHVEAEEATASTGGANGDAWNLWSNGSVTAVLTLEADGTYVLRARVWGQQAGPELPRLALEVDGVAIAQFDVAGTQAAPEVFEAEVALKTGLRQVGVSFLNDYYDPDAGADRNLLVDWFQLEGPTDLPTVDTSKRDAILTCDPAVSGQAACAEEVLAAFGERAWRRPLQAAEIAALSGFVTQAVAEGDDFATGIGWALKAMLVSPHFLFRVELDSDPTAAEAHPLSDWELASRLSYFLWSSMPDAPLMAAAKAGKLRDPAEIEAQVARMLADDRSWALVDNFAGQWLYLRALKDRSPDPWVYPSWDEALRQSLQTETELFFRTFIDEDRSMEEMLTASDSFVDARLAEHYGVPAPAGGGFERVTLQTPERGGILTHGSILTVHSYPKRTSPVLRGKWVLGELLCSEPPPPPAGVEGLEESADETLTLAEALAKHRQDPLCASCHDQMDPIGLGMENYDGIGAWRELDNGKPITPEGELPSGQTFSTPRELAALLVDDPRYARCVAEKLFIYALGRGATHADDPYLDAITEAFVAGGMRFSQLAALIATSEPFMLRRGEPVLGGAK